MTDWIALYLKLAAVLTPVVACVAVGSLWGLRGNDFPGQFVGKFTVGVTVPALAFHTLVTTGLDDAILIQVGLITVVGLALCAVFGAIVLRVLGLPAASLTPATIYPNAGNLGLPVAALAFGENGLAVAIAVFTVCSLVQHSTTAWWLGRVSGHAGSASGSKTTSVPIIVACLAAVAVKAGGITLPEPVLDAAHLLGSLAVPMMLVSLGYALVTVTRKSLGQGAVVGITRIVGGLFAGVIVALVFNLPPMVLAVIQMQLLMPVAVVSYLYSDRLTPYGAVGAGSVVASTLVFLVIAPLMLMWAATVPAG